MPDIGVEVSLKDGLGELGEELRVIAEVESLKLRAQLHCLAVELMQVLQVHFWYTLVVQLQLDVFLKTDATVIISTKFRRLLADG